MLIVHTITKGDLEREAIKNNWTDYSVAIIKRISREWFDSRIAESVLLFFNVDFSGGLHSYMPVVPNYDETMPEVINFPRENGEAKIIGVNPYKKSIEISYDSLDVEDDTIITRTMEKHYWNGNVVFILVRINIKPLAKKTTIILRTPVKRGCGSLGYRRQRCYKRRNQLREKIRSRRKNHSQKRNRLCSMFGI